MYGTRAVGAGLLALVALGAVTGCGGGDGGGETTDRATSSGGDTADGGRSAVSVLGSRASVTADRVTLDLRLHQPEGVDPPIARTATVTLPTGVAFHGDAQTTCSVATVRADGAAACPKASIIGSGHAIGKADTAQTDGKITILNGGPDTVLLATVVRSPAYVKTVVAAKLTTDDAGGLRVTFRFPRDLQVVAGVPVGLQRLQLTLQRSRAIVIAPCPPADRPWRYAAAVGFVDETTVDHSGAAACR